MHLILVRIVWSAPFEPHIKSCNVWGFGKILFSHRIFLTTSSIFLESFFPGFPKYRFPYFYCAHRLFQFCPYIIVLRIFHFLHLWFYSKLLLQWTWCSKTASYRLNDHLWQVLVQKSLVQHSNVREISSWSTFKIFTERCAFLKEQIFARNCIIDHEQRRQIHMHSISFLVEKRKVVEMEASFNTLSGWSLTPQICVY